VKYPTWRGIRLDSACGDKQSAKWSVSFVGNYWHLV